MTCKVGQTCDQCFKGKFEHGPFETAEGPYIFCNKCGYSETIDAKDAPPPMAWFSETKMTKKDEPVKPQPTPTPPTATDAAIRYPMMPKHTNMYGTVFGGIMLSLIDQAAFVEARKHGMHRWVTASIEKVDFLKPVRVGDTVSLYSRTIKTGTKSVQVAVEVEVDRYDTDDREHVCSAAVTMVSVDPNGKPIPFTSPPTIQYRA